MNDNFKDNRLTMRTLNTLLFLLILPLLANSQDRQADSLVLVEIYHQLDGSNWQNPENWLSDESLDEWKGIQMENDRVVKLEIIQQNAVGPFPDQILGLDQLHTFEIRSAEISGDIPADLVQLTKLSRFILSSTGIEGEMPNFWTQFPDLKTLSLSIGNLTGSLPDLPNGLFLVSFQGNKLSGPIPVSWEGNDLGDINISANELTGNFDVFSTWPNLRKVDLDNNNWDTALLPTWIDDNPILNRFSCSDCNIIGDLPSELDFSQHYNLAGMFLNNNQLTGDITLLFPPEDTDTELYLSVSGNQFEGEFPAHLVKGLSRLIIQFNNYSTITEFGDIMLDVCNIKGNKFTYETLMPVQEFVTNFEDIPLQYKSQQSTLTADSLMFDISTDLTILAGDNHPNTVYEWVKNNVIIEGETGPELTVTIDGHEDNGIYFCNMTNPDFPELNLRRNSIHVNWNPITSTKNILSIDVKVYPNPTKDFIKIELPEYTGNISFQIISMDGHVVREGVLSGTNNINVQNLNNGIYIMNAQLDNNQLFQKLIEKF